jgi:hypothetical protein
MISYTIDEAVVAGRGISQRLGCSLWLLCRLVPYADSTKCVYVTLPAHYLPSHCIVQNDGHLQQQKKKEDLVL